MTAYNYSNISTQTTLAAGITPTSQVVSLTSAAGLPVSFPFTLIIDYGQANVEVVTATGLSGSNYTVTRGEDGTAAQSHNPGAVVVHGVVARDLKGPQDHMAASTGVHGATSAVVGTADVQTLSGKTINGANNTLTVRDADVTALSASKLTGNFNGGSSFVATADATVPLTAKGTASATGNLLEVYAGTANQFAVSANGTATLGGGVVAGGTLAVTRTTASGLMLTGKVAGDTQSRFISWVDGTFRWGTGSGATDVIVARTAANTLGVTGTLTVSAAPTGATDVTTKAYVDARPVGSTVCTSTTRPTGAARFTGMEILETDTGLTYWWTGTDWKRTDWGQAWGVIGGKRYTSGTGALLADNSTAGVELSSNLVSPTMTLKAGRSYEVRCFARVSVTVAGAYLAVACHDYKATNADVSGTVRGQTEAMIYQINTPMSLEFAGHYDCVTDETKAWVIGGLSLNNAGHKFYSGNSSVMVGFKIYDVGPAGLVTSV